MIDSKVIPDNIARWLSPEDRRMLGKGAMTTEQAVQKAVFNNEKEEHKTVLTWLKRNQLKYIHAGTHRAVHDLEPGHPDFTVFFADQFRFYEMKVEGGKFSPDQLRVIAEHATNQTSVWVTISADQTISYIKNWLYASYGWIPKEP